MDMAVLIDIFGSCVCRDIFRHVDKTKYEVRRCLGNIPVTTLFDKRIPIKKEMMDEAKLTPYEKKMLRIQMKKNAVELLKKSDAEILVIDFADELMERWEIASEYSYNIAVPEGKENEYEKIFGDLRSGKIRQYSPFELDIEEVEQSIKIFAERLIRSEENPDGYEEKNIIVVESLYTADVMGNDAKLHEHKGINAHVCNEFLRNIYRLFYKYAQNCQIIKLPEFTHSTENHIRGLHPLHYMERTYDYFVKSIDVLNNYSKINSIQNLYKEYSLINKLETRTANSSAIYSIDGIKKRVEKLEEKDKPINIDIFGSCVSRDIFRFITSNRYKVCTNIQRYSISSLYQDPINEEFEEKKFKVSKYEQKQFRLQLEQNTIDLLKQSEADILIIDLGEERQKRYSVKCGTHNIELSYWNKVKPMYDYLFTLKNGFYKLENSYSALEISEKIIREKFKRFAEDIVKSQNNPRGYLEENIYVIEAKYADKIIDNTGKLRDYKINFNIKKYNDFWNKLYSILYEYIPNCKKIKLPRFTYASENHMWGINPLHYTSETYYYLADIVDTLMRISRKNTPDNLYKEKSLENRLLTRVLNNGDLSNLSAKVEQLEKKIKELEKNI